MEAKGGVRFGRHPGRAVTRSHGGMPLVPKAIYRFGAVPVKILTALSTEIEETVLKSVSNPQRHRRAQPTWRRNKAAGIAPPDCKVCREAIGIETVRRWWNRRTGQWSGTESPEKTQARVVD